MNRKGNPGTLVARQRGNTNAVKGGVYSARMLGPRAAEIEGELRSSLDLSPTLALAVHEAAKWMAILEAIDADLEERGLFDKRGGPRAVLEYRATVSRRLESWLAKVAVALPKGTEEPAVPLARPDYLRALQRIAIDPTTQASVRVRALTLLIRVNPNAFGAGSPAA